MIQTQIFLGCHLTKEIKLHLSQSSSFKELKNINQSPLIEIQTQEKEYIGQFIPNPLPCTELKAKEKEIKAQLQHFCPKISFEKHRAYLVTQIFIG